MPSITALALGVALATTTAAQERSAPSWRDAAAAASANSQAAEPIEPHTFGTTSSIDQWILAPEFMPGESVGTFTFIPPGYLARTNSTGSTFFAQLDLPAGALLQELKLYFFDTDPAENLDLLYIKSWTNADGTESVPGFSFTTFSTSGNAGYGALTVPINETIRYRQNMDGDPELEDVAYAVAVDLKTFDGGGAPTHRFKGVRALWKRQISPAPITPFFTDVPTNHQFFQAIEALAASAITVGSSCPPAVPPSYCPNNNVTRGQMAAFIARALGLHWPN